MNKKCVERINALELFANGCECIAAGNLAEGVKILHQFPAVEIPTAGAVRAVYDRLQDDIERWFLPMGGNNRAVLNNAVAAAAELLTQDAEQPEERNKNSMDEDFQATEPVPDSELEKPPEGAKPMEEKKPELKTINKFSPFLSLASGKGGELELRNVFAPYRLPENNDKYKNAPGVLIAPDLKTRSAFFTRMEQLPVETVLQAMDDATKLDYTFLNLLFNEIVQGETDYFMETGGNFKISMPEFCQNAGIYYKGSLAKGRMKDRLDELTLAVGFLPSEGIARPVLDFEEGDWKEKTLTFRSPYLYKVIEMIRKEKIEAAFVAVMKTEAAREKNKMAVEVLKYLMVSLARRGVRSDYTLAVERAKRRREKMSVHYADKYLVTYRTTCESIVENIPALAKSLKRTRSIANKDHILERAFGGAYDLLYQITDINDRYMDLKVGWAIPTTTTLDQKITITHHGRNGDYKRI